VRNQSFEIGLLDEVARNLDRAPVVLNLGVVRLAAQPMATEGLGQMQRFIRWPIPSPLDALAAPGPVTARDVQFAKGMTIHHRAALDMARAYHANPDAWNRFLGLMSVDIITDHSQEIALMRSVIAAYPGDPDAVRVDASMIHGMEGMPHGDGHGAHAGHGGTAMPQPEAAPPAARPAKARAQRPTPGTPAARRARPAHQGHGTSGQDEHAHHH